MKINQNKATSLHYYNSITDSVSINPWDNLNLNNKHGFILNKDLPYVHVFNTSRTTKQEHRIHIYKPPEPRMGPINAPVFILLLNPSIEPVNITRSIIIQTLKALKNEHSPHFCITKKIGWWIKHNQEIIQSCENNITLISKKMCSLEYFPYASHKFNHEHIRLPSQEYTFNLLRQAISNNSIIISARGHKLWLGAVPELCGYPDYYPTKTSQRAWITKNNLPDGAFKKIIERIKEKSL